MKTLDLIFYQYSVIVQCLYIWTLNDKQQFYAVSFTGTIQSFEQEEIMIYGIWSRFTPLSTISQTGSIGIFDSHCFHLNSALESENKRINFVYYDCINKEQMIVSKFIQFISNEGKQYKFEIILDSMKYEYYWYFFAVHLQPRQNSFTYYLLQGENIVDIQTLHIQFPYLDERLTIVFGGSLIIDDYQILQVEDTSKLSYFPGKITLLEHSKGYFGKLDIDVISYIETTYDGTCQCYENQIKNLVDVDIDWLDYKIFASTNENCDYFAFQTWIKVQQIISDSPEFLYQLFKLSGNFENQKLRDDNLSALQIFYQFSKETYQIKFTTYSYTIPYYNLDFTKNPFLIEYFYDLPNIYLWQFVTVVLKNNIIEIKVTLFEGKNQNIFFRSTKVNQFHVVQYKLQFGNIFQSTNNYLKVYLRESKFFNCVQDDQMNQKINCHYSCKDCDGPTNQDCLSCPETSRRTYNPKYKVCICPYDTIDDGDCKDYQSLNLIIQQDAEQKCKQGYFDYKSYCYKCPSIIRDNLITCLECITDPKNWIDNPYCQTNLFLDDIGSPVEFIKDLSQTYYIFDGDNLKACSHNQNYNVQTIDEVFVDYQLETNQILSICSNSKDPYKCLPCNFIGCVICGVISTTQICLQCDIVYVLRDGLCVELIVGQIEQEKCVAPYYITSEKQCSLCQIENCQYCFEYKSNDLTQCTLYKDFYYFQIDEFHKVGCALCEDGFIFDFLQGKCHYQKPQTINCLRAFIDLQGREICTLSAVDDFSIAPEIVNCQKYISNCKQCYQTLLSVIKCIVCEDGYSSSIITGHCQKCNSVSAKFCIEGDFLKLDAWMQLLQSFLMQFLPNRYVYSQSISILNNQDLPIKCIEGYELNKILCKKYCDSNCSVCKKMENPNEGFQCAKCFLNYYMEPVRVRDQGKCIACAQLCQVCQPRTAEEIQRVNPFFIDELDYSTYTMKCIKSIPHPNIFIDPNIQIAKYCYNQQCNSLFQYKIEIDQVQSFFVNNENYFNSHLNFKYLNEMAYEKLSLIFPFQVICNQCFYSQQAIFDNILKQKIFSIQFVELVFQGNHQSLKFFQMISIIGYDSFKIKEAISIVENLFELILNNYEMPQDFLVADTEFIAQENKSIKFEITSSNYQNIHLSNLKFVNLNILDSSMFEIMPFGNQSEFIINKFIFENCTFTNTTIFRFKNNIKVTILDLIVIDCKFLNSQFAIFQFDLTLQSNVYIQFLLIKNSHFQQSYIIKNATSLSLNNISLLYNTFLFTQIIEFRDSLLIRNILIQGNTLIQSQILIKIATTHVENSVIIDQSVFEENYNTNSSILLTDFSVQNGLNIYLMNLNLNENKQVLQESLSTYLFDINCLNLSIYNFSTRNSDYFNYFNLIAIPYIKVYNASFQNPELKTKVPLYLNCIQAMNLNSQLFYVQGFNYLELVSITIMNYQSIDQSFISIFSNIIKTMKENEIINISDLKFIGNTLLKINLRNIFSLMSIYSEKSQLIKINNIQFEENVYHQYIDDSSQNTASLLFINAQQSSAIVSNLSCQLNVLTNSTSSFILIKSKVINLSEFTIKNHNILNTKFLLSLFDFEFKNDQNQNQINQILQRILKIKNKEGVLSFTAEYCSITTGTIQNILSLNSQLFNIHTQGIGVFKLFNLNIISIESLDLQNSESGGCITISSQNSLLQLELVNLYLIGVQNAFASPIIFIQPSQNKNSIIIRNITASNCFSLMNLLLKTEFPSMNQKNNKVLIENIKITQNKIDLFQYLQKFTSLSSIDTQRVLNDNGVIIVHGCILTVRKFLFEGVLYSSILKVGDAFRVNIEKIHLNQISMILQGNLINIVQSSNNECVVKMQDLVFSNITLIESLEFKNLSSSQNIIEIFDSQCSSINDIRISNIQSADIGFQQFFDKLISESVQQGSVIYFQSQSNPIKIILSSISATYVRAQPIFNAILYFNLSGISSIDIIDFHCLWNNLNRYGCIFAQSTDQQHSNIKLKNSICYSNNGGFGTGIYTKNTRVVMHNSRIMKNYAEVQGGGLNLQSQKNDFLIKNTFIQENQANEAGGIYLNGDSNLNNQNFINSILWFNKAKLSPQNLQEVPTHLQLSINDLEMPSISKAYEKILINFLNIDPYYIIEQGKIIKVKVLVLPSNQVIKKYLIFNPNNQKFQKYIYEFSILFKNSLNEQLISFTNSTCVIKEQILSEDKLELSKTPQMTSFKTTYGNFDLSELQFSFDPYMENNKQQQILIICQANNTFTELYYNIKIATLKCQLGEFYMSNSCQPCQSNQGYYSVTYNTTKCSIFDKNKFENITSNQINLKVGYWRPNQFSDNIESCFKYPTICRGGWFVGDQLCLSGYLGGLCEECDKYNIRGHGYYFINQYSLLCHECDSPSNRILLFIVASIWQNIFLYVLGSLLQHFLHLVALKNQISNLYFANQDKNFLILFSNLIQVFVECKLDHGSIIIKLFLNYLWIFSAIFSFNISFTFSFNFIDQTSNPSYFMANNLDCFLSKMNDIQLIYLRIITMFILMLCILLFIYIGFVIIELLYKKQFDASILSITALYLYVSNYASLIKQFFSLLAKRQISDINYIQGDVSLIFGTPNHIKWILSFIIPGLGLIGWLLPFTLLVLLYVRRHQIESIKFRKHFCYLFNEYNKENFFWEWVKLAQKTFVIVILTYFETNIYLKASLLGLCLLLYQLYALEQQPYIIQNFNKLDVKTGQICSISIFLAVIKYICEQHDNYTTSFIIQMILVILCIRLSYPFFKSLITLYHKKYKKQILLQLLNLTKILSCTSCIDRYLRNKLVLWNQKEQRIKSIFYKLRHHLIYISKLQLEQQRQNQKLFRSLTSFIPPESLPRYKQLKGCISSSQL